ncbi:MULTISPECIES: LysR substrate-binding domain-containing protein [Burkholderia]|uniref:LysR substrate-binding domain-containing protein n=1 Tax=Burkholderia TaxID=32008 RepID=UPI0011A20B97|nr:MULTISPECIES: LysR substrate-binding domain-containing protein [Burkholderia]MDN7737230.1 LysR substrate-binding domain-containing protein [Burkholderia gladioli]
MAARTNLDMDVLRTFVLGFQLGSFARAAERLGRSQSAVSTQLRKLEDQVGAQLVRRTGRGLALTAAGEALLGYARRLLELNDEALDTVRGTELEGWIRLGMPQDFADTFLPGVLGRFTRAHPKVRVEMHVERSAPLKHKVLKGALDVALAWNDGDPASREYPISDVPMAWIGRPDLLDLETLAAGPVPLIVFEQPCPFRAAAISALDKAGIAWNLVFSTPSLSGMWAAAEAGLGVAVRTAVAVPHGVEVLDHAALGLPALPSIALALYRADSDASPAHERLVELVLDAVREAIGRQGKRNADTSA